VSEERGLGVEQPPDLLRDRQEDIVRPAALGDERRNAAQGGLLLEERPLGRQLGAFVDLDSACAKRPVHPRSIPPDRLRRRTPTVPRRPSQTTSAPLSAADRGSGISIRGG